MLSDFHTVLPLCESWGSRCRRGRVYTKATSQPRRVLVLVPLSLQGRRIAGMAALIHPTRLNPRSPTVSPGTWRFSPKQTKLYNSFSSLRLKVAPLLRLIFRMSLTIIGIGRHKWNASGTGSRRASPHLTPGSSRRVPSVNPRRREVALADLSQDSAAAVSRPQCHWKER